MFLFCFCFGFTLSIWKFQGQGSKPMPQQQHEPQPHGIFNCQATRELLCQLYNTLYLPGFFFFVLKIILDRPIQISIYILNSFSNCTKRKKKLEFLLTGSLMFYRLTQINRQIVDIFTVLIVPIYKYNIYNSNILQRIFYNYS